MDKFLLPCTPQAMTLPSITPLCKPPRESTPPLCTCLNPAPVAGSSFISIGARS